MCVGGLCVITEEDMDLKCMRGRDNMYEIEQERGSTVKDITGVLVYGILYTYICVC